MDDARRDFPQLLTPSYFSKPLQRSLGVQTENTPLLSDLNNLEVGENLSSLLSRSGLKSLSGSSSSSGERLSLQSSCSQLITLPDKDLKKGSPFIVAKEIEKGREPVKGNRAMECLSMSSVLSEEDTSQSTQSTTAQALPQDPSPPPLKGDGKKTEDSRPEPRVESRLFKRDEAWLPDEKPILLSTGRKHYRRGVQPSPKSRRSQPRAQQFQRGQHRVLHKSDPETHKHDNFFSLGASAIATRKEHWEYRDEPTGERMLERSIENCFLSKVEKSLEYYNSTPEVVKVNSHCERAVPSSTVAVRVDFISEKGSTHRHRKSESRSRRRRRSSKQSASDTTMTSSLEGRNISESAASSLTKTTEHHSALKGESFHSDEETLLETSSWPTSLRPKYQEQSFSQDTHREASLPSSASQPDLQLMGQPFLAQHPPKQPACVYSEQGNPHTPMPPPNSILTADTRTDTCTVRSVSSGTAQLLGPEVPLPVPDHVLPAEPSSGLEEQPNPDPTDGNSSVGGGSRVLELAETGSVVVSEPASRTLTPVHAPPTAEQVIHDSLLIQPGEVTSCPSSPSVPMLQLPELSLTLKDQSANETDESLNDLSAVSGPSCGATVESDETAFTFSDTTSEPATAAYGHPLSNETATSFQETLSNPPDSTGNDTAIAQVLQQEYYDTVNDLSGTSTSTVTGSSIPAEHPGYGVHLGATSPMASPPCATPVTSQRSSLSELPDVSESAASGSSSEISKDFEFARSIQQQFDAEIAQQMQAEMQQGAYEGAGRARRSEGRREGASHPGRVNPVKRDTVAHNTRPTQLHSSRRSQMTIDQMQRERREREREKWVRERERERIQRRERQNRLRPSPGAVPSGGAGVLAEGDMDMSYETLLQLQDVPRGIPREEIVRLTDVYVYEAPQTDMVIGDEEKKCCVCMDDFEPGQILRSLPCIHSFHQECIDEWLVGDRRCPVCMKDVEILAQNNAELY